MYEIIAIVLAAVTITALLVIFRKRKKHWQQGYIMVGNFKSKEKPKEDYPIYHPPQEEKNEDEIIMPPGMFD